MGGSKSVGDPGAANPAGRQIELASVYELIENGRGEGVASVPAALAEARQIVQASHNL